MRKLAFAALLLTACDWVPEVGGPLAERCKNADSDPSSDVHFNRDVQPLIARTENGCVPCHDPASRNAIGFTLGGLDLTNHEGLIAGGVRSGASNVLPGRPCESVLYRKILPGPPFGGRMPLNGPPYLTEAEATLIHDWIAEGAHND